MNITLLRTFFHIVLLSSFVLGCNSGTSESPSNFEAKNIIIFIGDGMGAEHRKAARWAVAGENGVLSMDDMPSSGLLQTHSANNAITDSAAAATAMASGVKTNNGTIGLDAGLNVVSTILEDAIRQGKRVGLITTTQITHATPASFAAHTQSRDAMTEIADQLLATGVDILLGGGEDEFLPVSEIGSFPEPGERDDGRNLVNEAIASGYTYVDDPVSFDLIDPSSTLQLIGLFADEGMTRPYSPSLAEMTLKATEILSQGPDGFFLLVEGGQIDWASHSNDGASVISDTIGLDEAVEVAKQFASMANDTLIIVTADHETGGLMVSSSPRGLPGEEGPFRMPNGDTFYINWSGTGHTAVNVPVTSKGPLSDWLNGVNDNTFLYDVMSTAF